MHSKSDAGCEKHLFTRAEMHLPKVHPPKITHNTNALHIFFSGPPFPVRMRGGNAKSAVRFLITPASAA